MMKEDNEEIDEVLYEHFNFVASDGQEPLRVDKFLMNFIENAHATRYKPLQKKEIFLPMMCL